MSQQIQHYMEADHARLDDLLAASRAGEADFDAAIYDDFRRGLLRHIALEEKILFREARARRDDQWLEVERTLRAQHSEIAHKMLYVPDAQLIQELRDLLATHNTLEEGELGVYAHYDALFGTEAEAILEKLKALPETRLAPLRPRPTSPA